MKLDIASAANDIREMYKAALLTREKSHSPYSGSKVGAAIKTAQGKIFSGCNVENASYGATVCAERVAIQKAVSEVGQLEVAEVMVVTHANPPWPPCGMCRQVIAEFGHDVKIYLADLNGKYQAYELKDLFPFAFTGSQLSK